MKQRLGTLLKKKKLFAQHLEETFEDETEELQHKMVRIQQGIWHRKGRAIVVFEGFDAAGKGGTIRTLTKDLDPRGVRVYPIGPPEAAEHERHWLYRFWQKIPKAGSIAIFDRSWYGRVLVEKVEKLITPQACARAYQEINQFEKTLMDDGIELVKIFLAISKEEQLRRFEDRLKDPYKQWKLTEDDLRARKKWPQYVQAVNKMIEHTSTKLAPWHVIASDAKPFARKEVLEQVTSTFKQSEKWMNDKIARHQRKNLEEAMKTLR